MSIMPQSGVGINAASPASLGTAGGPSNVPNCTYNSEDVLDPDTFVKLAKASGEDRKTQGAVDDPDRLPSMVDPKKVVVTAKNANGEVIGAAIGTHYGEYAYMAHDMVAPCPEQEKIKTQLMQEFQKKVIQLSGNKPTSVFTLSGDHKNPHDDSYQSYINHGFKPLQNALFVERGEQIR